jgi:hypothetical protein
MEKRVERGKGVTDLRVKRLLGSRPAINMKGEFWQDARGET